MNLAELFGDASQQIVNAIKRGLVQDKSHRNNPHSRQQTKAYADKRQKGGRAYYLKHYGGSHYVAPQPSEKAKQRREGRVGPTKGTRAYARWLKRGGKHAAEMGESMR